ncbi:hypothetical protein AcW1_005912 [Taiwanofungus camphoratus]|nr:hypothetical protein AcW1_005912 [Antrodia cinnamomea]
MALPSRPNVRVGLPSNPAPRSRSRSAVRQRNPEVNPPRPGSRVSDSAPSPTFIATTSSAPSPIHQVRHPRSLGDLRSSSVRSRSAEGQRGFRSTTPPPPLPISSRPLPQPPVQNAEEIPPSSWKWRDDISRSNVPPEYYTPRKRSDVSVTSWSSSSSGSSMGDSFRSGYASSRTSFGEGSMDTVKGGDQGDVSPVAEKPNKVADGFGTSLWTRVTSAAGNLKVSMSKVLANGLATSESGEATPFGQESSLSRAMKAYHIEKARDASDLPDWLFEGRDREVISRLRNASTSAPQAVSVAKDEHQATTSPVAYHRRGVSDAVQEDPDGSTPAWRPTHSRSSSYTSVHSTHHSRDKMNRLKELRIAKRNAKVRFADDDEVPREPVSAVENNVQPQARHSPPPRRPITPVGDRGRQARVGLPSGVRPQRV